MTDRYHSLTVVLAEDIREDDAKVLMQAIRMIRGVLTVSPHVADHNSLMAEHRAKAKLQEKLWDLLK